jgi:hypothetical protein
MFKGSGLQEVQICSTPEHLNPCIFFPPIVLAFPNHRWPRSREPVYRIFSFRNFAKKSSQYFKNLNQRQVCRPGFKPKHTEFNYFF